MTTTEKAVTRESTAEFQGRRIIVQLEGKMVRFRRKGLRSEGWMGIPIEEMFILAARAHLGRTA